MWDALTFAPVIHQKGLLPLDPVIMAGGMPYYTSNWSVAMYLSYDMGITCVCGPRGRVARPRQHASPSAIHLAAPHARRP